MMAKEQRLIDANALWAEISEDNPLIHLGPFGYVACSPKTDGELVHKRADVLRAIESAPTVDAVEVVRCKDCKHSYEGVAERLMCGRCGQNRNGIRLGGSAVKEEHFCSYGERREKNDVIF